MKLKCLTNVYLTLFTVIFTLSYFSPTIAAQVVANGTSMTTNGGTASTTANNEPAMLAMNGGMITSNGTTVTTSGNNSNGATATTNGTITFNGSSVTTSGTSSYGIYANQGGAINANGLFISTTGANSAGAVADAGGTVNLNGTTIQTGGTNAAGILALTGGVVSGSSNVSTTNTGSAAMSAAGGTINETGGSISTSGASSPAFSASLGGTLTSGGFGAQTYGANSPGASATSGGIIKFTSGSLQTYGTGSDGAFSSDSGSSISMSSFSLLTNNINSPGLAAQSGGLISVLNSSVTTNGSGSPAVYLSNGGVADVTNSSATAQGSGSYGLSVDNAAGNASSTFNLTNASLHSNSADAIHINSASVTVNANQGSINAGSNGVFVSATNGIGIINGNNYSQFSGLINANASIVNLSLTNGSTWTGSTSTLNNLNIDSTSQWNMNLSSTVNGTAILAGTIDITAPTIAHNTLTFNGNLIGQNGKINMYTTLNGDDSPSDVIRIGGSSQGSTGLSINNFNGVGEETNQGILVVNGINGGVVGDNSFYLTTPQVAGPYQYLLYRQGNNLYLRNSVDSGGVEIPDPGTPEDGGSLADILENDGIIDPPAGFVPGEAVTALYRPEVSWLSSLPTLALIYDRTLLGNLHQRLGETSYLCNPEQPWRKWIRFVYNNGYLHNGTIYRHGPNFNYQVRLVQAGFDIYNFMRDSNHYMTGLFAATGNLDGNVSAPFIISTGHNHINAWSFGGYFTYIRQNSLYLDAVVQGTSNQVDADVILGDKPCSQAWNWTASLESGYRFPIFNFAIEPQLQFVSQWLSMNNMHIVAANVRYGQANPYTGRIGLLAEYNKSIYMLDPLMVWLRGNYWHTFNNNTHTYFSSATGYIPFASPLASNTLEAELGFNARVYKFLSLFGTVSRNYFSGGNGSETRAALGISLSV